jgi:hypothetical protein
VPAARSPVLFAEGSWPGVARQQVTFFCFAKRKSPKKRRPAVWVPTLRYGQPAVLEPSGVRLNSLRSDNAGPDPLVSALLGPARTGQSGTGAEAGTEEKYQRTNQGKKGLAVASPCFFKYSEFGFCIPRPHPLWMRRGAEVQTDQGSRCLSEASLARPRLDRAPQVARSAAEGRSNQGRLFFCLLFFWRSKRKVSSCRATPGQPPSAESTPIRNPSGKSKEPICS